MPHYKDTAANRKLGRVGKPFGKVTASSGMKFKIKAKPPPVAAPRKAAVAGARTTASTLGGPVARPRPASSLKKQ